MLGACQLSGGNSLGTWSWAAGGFPPDSPRAWPAYEGCGRRWGPETALGVLGLGFNSTVGNSTEEAMPLKIVKSGILSLQF